MLGLLLFYKKSGSTETYKELRKVTNKLRQATRKARMRYFGRKMSEYKDSEQLWKFSKIQANWPLNSVPSTIIKDGVRLTDPVDVANAIQDVLLKKVEDILSGIPDDGTDPLSYTKRWLEGKNVPTCQLTTRATYEEVEAAMKSLRSTDAAGHDELTTRLIKFMAEPLACVMTHLVNLSFEKETFPDVFKLAKISPLFKKGDKFDAKNYRPVAVLPAMSKVVEKIVITRLKTHLEKNRLLADTQNAYREKRSVTTAMLQLHDEILKKQDENVDSACIFLDCSAAFDTISHRVLLGKLKLYGVDEQSLRWVTSYLAGRAQFVSIGGKRSDIRKILDGAFQGSIGGPWCFLLMINDIVILGKAGTFTIYIYADDSCLRVDLSGNIEADQRLLDEIMKDVVKYMNSQKLKFNFGKSEFVIASPKRHADYQDLVLNFSGNVVKQQLHARLLGLQVSWDLTHTWYVNEMKNCLLSSLNKRLYVLNKLKDKCPKKCVKNLAHGLIYSKLIFGIQYWSKPLPEELWQKIQVIVNKAARAVLKISPLQMHVLDLYRVLDWLPASACRDFQDISLFWSIKHNRIPSNLSLMFASHTDTISLNEARPVTRSVTQNSINRTQENDSRSQLRSVSFVPRMVRIFNSLDQEFKQLPDSRDKYGYPKSAEQKYQDLKYSLRNMVQWKHLGPPCDWPERKEDAMLDRDFELRGLGVNSDTSDDDNENVPN